jgi:hypothetical protein
LWVLQRKGKERKGREGEGKGREGKGREGKGKGREGRKNDLNIFHNIIAKCMIVKLCFIGGY